MPLLFASTLVIALTLQNAAQHHPTLPLPSLLSAETCFAFSKLINASPCPCRLQRCRSLPLQRIAKRRYAFPPHLPTEICFSFSKPCGAVHCPHKPCQSLHNLYIALRCFLCLCYALQFHALQRPSRSKSANRTAYATLYLCHSPPGSVLSTESKSPACID